MRGANDGSYNSAESTPQKSVRNCSDRSELAPLLPAASRSRRSDRGAPDKSHEKSDSSTAPSTPLMSHARVHFADLLPCEGLGCPIVERLERRVVPELKGGAIACRVAVLVDRHRAPRNAWVRAVAQAIRADRSDGNKFVFDIGRRSKNSRAGASLKGQSVYSRTLALGSSWKDDKGESCCEGKAHLILPGSSDC